jgi:ATP-binding cassette subfamily B protein
VDAEPSESQTALGRLRRVLRMLTPYARPHRDMLILGVLATLLIVGARLAAPWPFRGLLELLYGQRADARPVVDALPAGVDPALVLGLLFVGVVLLQGLGEYVQRLAFARFAIRMVHDTRAAALARLFARRVGLRSDPGDAIARTVGDTARIKAGLKGVLIHVAQNGLLVAGVAVILVLTDRPLGLVYLIGNLAATAVAIYGAAFVAKVAHRHRRKEGRLASKIHLALVSDEEPSFVRTNRTSGQADAEISHYEGLTTWAIHLLLGTTGLLIVLFGAHRALAGDLSVGALFTFTAYILMAHDPTVRLGRQVARVGPILACAERLADVFDGRVMSIVKVDNKPELGPLRKRIEISDARLAERVDLTVQAGERVVIYGDAGSGKTALLELLAGLRVPERGTVRWDKRDLRQVTEQERQAQVALLSQAPVWERQPLSELVGATEGDLGEAAFHLAQASGLTRYFADLPRGLRTKLSSFELSMKRRKLLGLLAVAQSSASLWLLDEPLAGQSTKRSGRLLEALFAAAGRRTLVLTTQNPDLLAHFDRVVILREGRVRYDGTTSAWLQRKKRASA